MKILACIEWDAALGSCAVEAWLDQPGLLPPLPVDQGLQISALLISIASMAWGFKYLRRYLSPKTG